MSGEIVNAAPLSDGERRQAYMNLMETLRRRAALYLAGESTSLPAETAAALLTSIRMALSAAGSTEQDWLRGPPDGALLLGLRRLDEMAEAGRGLWLRAARLSEGWGSVSLGDTLRSMGRGFRLYDTRFFAQSFPCDIDYQLCLPVPEELPGIEYINEYLRRLNAELSVLSRLPRAETARLLDIWCPDWRELPVNLCEPALQNSLCRALLGRGAASLNVTAADRGRAAALLGAMAPDELRKALKNAALRFCRGAGIGDEFTRAYLCRTAGEYAPRIAEAVKAGDVSGVFFEIS